MQARKDQGKVPHHGEIVGNWQRQWGDQASCSDFYHVLLPLVMRDSLSSHPVVPVVQWEVGRKRKKEDDRVLDGGTSALRGYVALAITTGKIGCRWPCQWL